MAESARRRQGRGGEYGELSLPRSKCARIFIWAQSHLEPQALNDMLPRRDVGRYGAKQQRRSARTRSAAKCLPAVASESALANVDVVRLIATFLNAVELCQVKATCKALGSANEEATFNELSITDEAARRVFESASDEEKILLPRYDGEGWIELYHHLLMLRARLSFDQLVGRYVGHRGGDTAVVQGMIIHGLHRLSQAICGGYIMRAGKHWATFTSSSGFDSSQDVGVIRPLPGWDKKGLDNFYPCSPHHNLQHERTDRWEGDVHYCCVRMIDGSSCFSEVHLRPLCFWSDWKGDEIRSDWVGQDNYNEDCTTLGMLLDLDNGTLSLYQNGRRLGTLMDGLAGEYCWTAGFLRGGDVSIRRGYSVNM